MGQILMPGGGGGADLDVITAVPEDVRAGKVIVDKDGEPVTGTQPYQGAWTGRIGFNGRLAIPPGIHNGGGYIDQALTWRGAPEYWLPINGTQEILEGYYSGGAVKQNIAVHGGQVITPTTYQQVAGTSGHYCTGNVVVNAIPSNYYDINQSQTVFLNGVFGAVVNKGWQGAYCSYSTQVGSITQITKLSGSSAPSIGNGELYMRAASTIPANGLIINGSIDFKPFKRLVIVARTDSVPSTTPYLRVRAINPANNMVMAKGDYAATTTNTETLSLDITNVTTHCWIIIYNNYTGASTNTRYIQSISLQP